MFKGLKRYNVILVTGPQRSGTTIAARAISHDTGHRYIDEQAFVATDEDKWREVVNGASNAVIQCPGMMRFVHEFGNRPDVLIVVMVRSVGDIVASQQRIAWTHESFEMSRYPDEWRRLTIAETKYTYWNEVQRRQCQNYYMLEYESLTFHELWVSPEQRAQFRPRQWCLSPQGVR